MSVVYSAKVINQAKQATDFYKVNGTSSTPHINTANNTPYQIGSNYTQVAPAPLSASFSIATNNVFTFPTTGKWSTLFTGYWSNSGTNGQTGGYVQMALDVKDGSGNAIETVSTVLTQPGPNAYSHQVNHQGFVLAGYTITPRIFSLYGSGIYFTVTSISYMALP
jgi:hypothetical protein